ncbi:hypothetical protein GDO86_013687 [Hymenochirus boettgeri]|uniref:Uncharacterized protein n=1 Tax=Hymenochirus boettgeri TaxID=247094 RepID=A0A8T2IVX0_9PIPI|nr:hypothetical protein GDO86_013687 [Hymenochirus boettgeri]
MMPWPITSSAHAQAPKRAHTAIRRGGDIYRWEEAKIGREIATYWKCFAQHKYSGLFVWGEFVFFFFYHSTKANYLQNDITFP